MGSIILGAWDLQSGEVHPKLLFNRGKNGGKANYFAIAGLCLVPFARGVKKLRPAPKVEKEGTSDLQQRGAAKPFSIISDIVWIFLPAQGWELSYANFAAAVI